MSATAISTGPPPAPADAGFADLHLHTLFSDGTFSPEELAKRGREVGLSAMALTDHDTTEGCPRMAAACQPLGLEFVPGLELTAQFQKNEVHILGYYIDSNHAGLAAQLKKFQSTRQDRIREMTDRLNAAGIPLKAESVFALANCRSPGRPHVARALVQEGFCANMEAAFEKFLKNGRPAWVPKFRISAVDAIALIHQAGGLAVLAHPALNHCDECIEPMAAQGLDGIECFHSKHSEKVSQNYLSTAARLNLLVTGGSDCHGFSKGKPLIGGVKLPGVYYGRFRAAQTRHRARGAAVPAAK